MGSPRRHPDLLSRRRGEDFPRLGQRPVLLLISPPHQNMKTPILMVTMLAAASLFASRADDAREAAAKAAGEKAEARETVKTEIRDAVKAEVRDSVKSEVKSEARSELSKKLREAASEEAKNLAEAKSEAQKNAAEAKSEAAKKLREAKKEAAEKENEVETENETEVEHARESIKDRIRLEGRRSEVRDVVVLDPTSSGTSLNIVKRSTPTP